MPMTEKKCRETFEMRATDIVEMTDSCAKGDCSPCSGGRYFPQSGVGGDMGYAVCPCDCHGDPDADADDAGDGFDGFDPMEAVAEAEACRWDDDANPYHGTYSEE